MGREEGGRDLPPGAPLRPGNTRRRLRALRRADERGEGLRGGGARALEALHDAFSGLLGKDRGGRRVRSLKAQVFGDSTDFRAFLAQEFPAESQGQGFYAFHKTTLYVYGSFDKGQETTWRTLFHEGTHQLLHMACSQDPQANRLPHFWALEAAPCWLEALEWDGKRLTLGDANPVRIANFHRLVKDRQLLPWGDFVRLDQSRFTSDSYEQGHALFWFLMQEDTPKRREKAVEYLKAVMAGGGRGTPDEDAFGEPLARLAEGVVPWVQATDGKTPPKRKKGR